MFSIARYNGFVALDFGGVKLYLFLDEIVFDENVFIRRFGKYIFRLYIIFAFYCLFSQFFLQKNDSLRELSIDNRLPLAI
jgi:hypothetical protein